MFEDALHKLRDLQRKAEQLDGEHSIPLTELFHDEFMLRNTEFPSIETMLEASGYKIESNEDFADIPDEEWDAFIRERTRCASWDEMKNAAAQEWVARALELQ
ncbi:MAG: hypothetical protein C4575_06625 [Desulforudis sp.]|jgi:hypothetical protein|nr:MAG: hypothetical protein C4575_06625 [Desulforudis sp.]